MTGKRVHLLRSVPIDTAPGLEIGPLTSPMVLKREGPIRYVDYLPTPELRARQHDPSVALNAIVEVDINAGARERRTAGSAPSHSRIDFLADHRATSGDRSLLASAQANVTLERRPSLRRLRV